MTPEPETRATALQAAAETLRRAGIEDARVDAEWLLAHLLGESRTMLRLSGRQRLTPTVARWYRHLIARRAAREPLAYLVGSQEFCGHELKVDRRALIPRWDTEPVVEALLRKLDDRFGVRVVEIGTGTGAIAVAVAKATRDVTIVATDTSSDALALAEENVARHRLAHRINLVQDDLAVSLRPRAGQFAAVVSNPPYIPTAVIETLEPEVREHEPRLALDGGADGLTVIRRLMPLAVELLAEGGWLVLEHGHDQHQQVADLARAAGLQRLETIVDLNRRQRGLIARKRAA